jgi:hypothetical protein
MHKKREGPPIRQFESLSGGAHRILQTLGRKAEMIQKIVHHLLGRLTLIVQITCGNALRG